jgi:hypothetical protein
MTYHMHALMKIVIIVAIWLTFSSLGVLSASLLWGFAPYQQIMPDLIIWRRIWYRERVCFSLFQLFIRFGQTRQRHFGKDPAQCWFSISQWWVSSRGWTPWEYVSSSKINDMSFYIQFQRHHSLVWAIHFSFGSRNISNSPRYQLLLPSEPAAQTSSRRSRIANGHLLMIQ